MLYLWLKYIHILSSTLLFGTGIGTAFVLIYGHCSRNLQAMATINQYVVFIDKIITGSSGFMQIVTGFWMVYLAGYPLRSLWIWGAIIGYLIAAICWFIVVYLQIQLKNITIATAKTNSLLPASYYYYFRWWFILGWPAFTSLLIVFYLMVMKPM